MPNIGLFENLLQPSGIRAFESIGRSIRRFAAGGGVAAFVNEKSLLFDGTNDFVLVPDDDDLDGQSVMSVSVWFKASALSVSRVLINKQAAAQRSYFIIQGFDNNIRINIWESQSDLVSFDTPNNSLTVDTWHHLVWVFNGPGSGNNGKVQIYIDAVLQTLTFSGFPDSTFATSVLLNSPLQLGIGGASGGGFTQGNVDEVAFFHVALNQAGVNALRDGTKPADLAGQTGLVHWWRMGDGDTFPTIQDNVGSLDGTMTNMAAEDIVEDVPA